MPNKRKPARKSADPAARLAALQARKAKLDLQIQIQTLKQQYRAANKK